MNENPIHYAALNGNLEATKSLANYPMCEELTDEISKEEDALSNIPEGHPKRRLYLDIKILRRDITLLAISMQELMYLEGENAKEIKELKRTNRILENFILDHIVKKPDDDA